MKKLLITLGITLLLTVLACVTKEVPVEKIVEVPVEVRQSDINGQLISHHEANLEARVEDLERSLTKLNQEIEDLESAVCGFKVGLPTGT